jgi:hypothetical protein
MESWREVIHNLRGVYDGGFDWVDESEEDLEGLCGLHDMNYGEVCAILSGLAWLRNGKHAMKDG